MKRYAVVVSVGLAVTLACMVVLTNFGFADITFSQTVRILLNKIFGLYSQDVSEMGVLPTIVWLLRFPRVMLAFIVGAGLAVCGSVYQAVFKNPMSDPFILGVSSGAAFGATIGIVLKLPGTFGGLNVTSWFAFAGSLVAIFAVYNIARVSRQTQLTALLLTGTAINQFLTAIVSLVMLFSESDMKKIYFWTLGSFSSKGWNHLIAACPYVLVGCVLVYFFSRDLDIIMLGDETAIRYGVETEKIKQILFLITALIMSACVSVCGIIGFVGLITPHVVRLFTGPPHKRLLPVAFMMGGLLLAVCDTIARSLITAEIPVGIISAALGAPFFLYLLRSRSREVV